MYDLIISQYNYLLYSLQLALFQLELHRKMQTNLIKANLQYFNYTLPILQKHLMQKFNSSQQSSFKSSIVSNNDHHQALKKNFTSTMSKTEFVKNDSRFCRQRSIKFEETLRTYEMPPSKRFHFDKNHLFQKDLFNEDQKLFPIQISKKIKTFQKGWIEKEKNGTIGFQQEKQNIYPMLFSVADQFQRIVKQKQDQKINNLKTEPVDFIKQEQDSYSNSYSQNEYQNEQALSFIPQKLSEIKQIEQDNFKNQKNQLQLVRSYTEQNLSNEVENLSNIIESQQKIKAIAENKQRKQEINLTLSKDIGLKVRQLKVQTPIKLDKIQKDCLIDQDNNSQKSSVNKFSQSPKLIRFIPIMPEAKYFSLRLLRQLFEHLNKNSRLEKQQNDTNPYKKNFKYLSNMSSQSKLERIKSINDICRYLKEQKQFLKKEEIIKVLKQFIVQEGLNVEYYFPQLEKADF